MDIDYDARMEEAQKRFWYNFTELCRTHHISLRKITMTLGIATSPITKWKNGSWPDTKTLAKIADFFGITIDELLGNYNDYSKTGPMLLSVHEKQIILAYRASSDSDRQMIDIITSRYEG